MAAVVADTHAVIWYLLDQQTLSPDANAAIEQAVAAGDPIYLSTISLIEIIYLVEKGRLPLKALEQLNKALDLSAAALVCVPITLDISRTPGSGIARCRSGHAGPHYCRNSTSFGAAINNQGSQNKSVASRDHLVSFLIQCPNHSSHPYSMKPSGDR